MKKFKKVKIALINILCIMFIILICIRFEFVSQSVKTAIDVGIRIIIPALFPFFVVSDVFVSSMTNINGRNPLLKIYEKLFRMPASSFPVFIIGIISGYPVGAAAAYSLYEKGVIKKKDAQDLLCYTNNSGPLFIICSVGCGMLSSLRAGIVLYAIHVISCIITGIAVGIGREKSKSVYIPTKHIKTNLAASIEKGFLQCIKVIGFVVFFSIITDTIMWIMNEANIRSLFFNDINYNIFASILFSALEITNGIKFAASNLSVSASMYIISFACAWSGVSVIFQTLLVTNGELSLRKYVRFKLFGSAIALTLCKIYLSFSKAEICCMTNLHDTKPVYSFMTVLSCFLIVIYIFRRKAKAIRLQ